VGRAALPPPAALLRVRARWVPFALVCAHAPSPTHPLAAATAMPCRCRGVSPTHTARAACIPACTCRALPQQPCMELASGRPRRLSSACPWAWWPWRRRRRPRAAWSWS